MRKGQFLKSTALYFIGNVLSKLISFFLLPLYTAHITPSDLGYYDVAVNLITAVSMVVFLNIWAGIFRFMFDSDSEEHKYQVINNGMLIFLVSWLLYTILVASFGWIRETWLLTYIYLYGVVLILHYIYGNLARAFGKNVLYAVSGVVASLVTFLISLVSILKFHAGVESLFYSLILGYVVQIFLLESRVRVLAHLSFRQLSWPLIRTMGIFCFPLMVSQILSWCLDGFNRLQIRSMLGLNANGYYAVAGRFAGLLALISSCIILAWQETIFSSASQSKEERAESYRSSISLYFFYLLTGISACFPAISLFFRFFINQAYNESYLVVPLYFFASGLGVFVNFFVQIFAAEKKTFKLIFANVITALANISMVFVLIPRLGLQGASLALVLAYTVGIISLVILSRDFAKITLLNQDNLFAVLLLGVSTFFYFKRGFCQQILALFLIITMLTIYKKEDVKKIYLHIKKRVNRKNGIC